VQGMMLTDSLRAYIEHKIFTLNCHVCTSASRPTSVSSTEST
jgi:mannitol-1-phosphate/altronate dehydrogenase